MKTHRLLIAAAALIALAGCSTIQSLIGTSGAQAALNATEATLLTYQDAVQPALLTFGQLPTCPQATGIVCKSPTLWAQMQATDKAVTATIVAAQSVLDGSQADTGQVAAALQAITNAEATYKANGVTIPSS